MIDKGLSSAPLGGLDGLAGLTGLDAPAVEIQIEDPEAMSITMPDGTVLELDDAGNLVEAGPEEPPFDANLAEWIEDTELGALASTLIEDFEEDCQSRKDWADTYVKGLKLLGLKIEDRTEPWPHACGVVHPMIFEAAVRCQSEIVQETLPPAGPVKTQIIGKETPEKTEAAARVQEDMNFKLTQQMTEYRPEHEKMALHLAIAGSAFKKLYFDPSIGRQVAPFVPAEDVVVPYGASSLDTADRVTHIMRKTKNELKRLQLSGFYVDIDLGEPMNVSDPIEEQKVKESGATLTVDHRYQLLEMQVNLDLKGYEDKDENGELTGMALPYIITIDRGTSKVLSLRRNWYEEDPLYTRRKHFVHYNYIPGFGFYGFGLIHLIGGHASASTSILRQLVDAGTLSNLPGGFKTKGMRIKDDTTPIEPGEFRDVDIGSGTLRENVLPLPYKEPSQVLMALMDRIVEDGRRFANTADMNVSDMSAQAPVGTTLALLERQLKVMSALQARVHNTMRQELTLLAGIIRDYTPESYEYEVEGAEPGIKKSDYDHVDILPVSDPNAATMSQKIVQYQAVVQLMQMFPQSFDVAAVCRQMVEVLGIKHAEKLVPLPDDKTNKPRDPVSENMALIQGKPVKAFIQQDHQAHIAVHQAPLNDPMFQQMLQKDPQAQQKYASTMAHIMEHMALDYRRQIEAQLGFPMPQDDESLPPDVEAQIAPMMAQAAIQLTQRNQQQAAQQQAQQQAQDPVLQMQQQELQLKDKEVQRKAAKDQADNAYKLEQLQIERDKLKQQNDELMLKLQVDATKAGKADETKRLITKTQAEANLIDKHLTRTHQKSLAEQQIQANKDSNKGKEGS
jgi:hypothetical protein